MGSGGHGAGWYPLPDGTEEGYWDGARWTDERRPNLPGPDTGEPDAAQSSLAVASLVLGLSSFLLFALGFVSALLGIVLGLLALQECEPNGPKQGRPLATTGILCALGAIAMWFVLLTVHPFS